MSEEIEIVGMRFRPTEEEIILYYLERKMGGLDFPVHCINEVDVLKYEPWDLPDLSARPDNTMWYFFNAPTYKYAKSKRTNRTTGAGYWKVTGKDRPIWDDRGTKVIGIKKNLVFYLHRFPNGVKTNWVIHEYHSNNAPLYQAFSFLFFSFLLFIPLKFLKEFVLWRLKRKSGNESKTKEPSRSSKSDSGNYVVENTSPQVNYDRPAVELDPLDSIGFDHNRLSASELPMHQKHGSLYSNLSINEFGSSSQEDDFFKSLLASKDGYWEKTLIHDKDNEKLYEESGQDLETPSSPDRDSSFRPVNSAADYPQINCIHLVHDDFPISKRTFKAQHLPKSEDFIKKECSPKTLQLWAKGSQKVISKYEGRAAEHAFYLPLEENSVVKFGAEWKKAQRIYSKKSLRFISNQSDGSNREGCFSSLETPFLDHKTNSEYIRNVLIAVILFIFFIWEIGSLH
ncbi:hypothetical protein Patl1_00721 [Pistacia atlantica]|uniref:Uncharacterized protein n=1 Tax=Pistacia atlantica TaxID=434234 RepID=A0ACC1C7X3_9ROSI|nr:hypothetical protein Patl1_00721 [Pistacia atlantica]